MCVLQLLLLFHPEHPTLIYINQLRIGGRLRVGGQCWTLLITYDAA
jgi:hypothetical protein